MEFAHQARPRLRRSRTRSGAAPMIRLSLVIGASAIGACAQSTLSTSGTPSPRASGVLQSGMAPSPDPRVGLRAGLWDAGQAAWNIR
ncbi:MAG TPA: hypothetical protein VKP00_15055, partial [Gemmatimonadaceae bacterium]|nr:hypothetical protein [Gemmatimonadaceae bacterium]